MKKILGSIIGLSLIALGCGCATQRAVLPAAAIPASTLIDEQVAQLFASDPELKRFDLKINTFRGHVKLDGVVDSAAQREQATKLTWAVFGVRLVENNLLLPSEKISDP